MKHYGQSDYEWKNNKLYLNDKKTGYSIVPDGGLGKMFKVRWPDGVLSEDYYNLTRAKDHASRLAAEDTRKEHGAEGIGQPADAFKSEIGIQVAK